VYEGGEGAVFFAVGGVEIHHYDEGGRGARELDCRGRGGDFGFVSFFLFSFFVDGREVGEQMGSLTAWS
jgi:hypothetical protein